MPRKSDSTQEQDEAPQPRIVSRTERNEATSFRDHGGGDPSEAPANNARPNDLGSFTAPYPVPNSTLAERAKAAEKRGAKRVAGDEAGSENKSVKKADSK